MFIRCFILFFTLHICTVNAQLKKVVMPSKLYAQSFIYDAKTIGNFIIKPKPNHVLLGIASGCLAMGLLYNDLEIKTWFQSNKRPAYTQASKYIEPMGRGSVAVGIIGSYFLLGVLQQNTGKQQQAMIAAKAIFFSSGMFIGGIKYITQRQRPYTTNNPLSFHGIWNTQKYRSFPSGHTSDAFCLATFFAKQCKRKWLAIPLYTCATAVGVSRIYDNKHWASDVFIGALLSTVTTHIVCSANKNGFNTRPSTIINTAAF